MTDAFALPRSQPRYQQLAQRLAEEIGSGDYAVGEYLPTESALAARFAVSRHTVREALRQLHALGVVASRQGKGTRVTAQEPSRQFLQSLDNAEDLLQYAGSHRLTEVTSAPVVAAGVLAARIGCAEGQSWLRFEAVRVGGTGARQVPVAWTEIYVAENYAGIRDDVGVYRGAIGHLIEERYGEQITELRQEVGAVSIDAELAPRLDVAPGAPGLEVHRWYIGRDGHPFEYTVAINRADRYRFSNRLRYRDS